MEKFVLVHPLKKKGKRSIFQVKRDSDQKIFYASYRRNDATKMQIILNQDEKRQVG